MHFSIKKWISPISYLNNVIYVIWHMWICQNWYIPVSNLLHGSVKVVQGVSKKRYLLDFLSYFSSRGRILLFHMCFGIRISSQFHLAFQKLSIQNLNCPKNAKHACADMIFIPAQSSLRTAGIKIYVFLVHCQTKPSSSLTNLFRCWMSHSTQCLEPVVPLAMFW